MKVRILFFATVIAASLLTALSCSSKDNQSAELSNSTKIQTQTYEKENVKFSLPNEWKVSEDFLSPWGSRYIGVDTSGIATVTVEVYDKDKLSNIPGNNNLEWYLQAYNQRANTITKITGEKDTTTREKINQANHEGIRETIHTQLFNKDVSYIREYYKFEMESKIAFVTYDSTAEEFENHRSGFNQLVQSFNQ